jgi:hypothetical protein
VPWARRVEAARRALGVTVGDTVVVEHAGLLRVGRVTAFDSSTRVGLRTTFQGMPVEVRRVGLEVRFGEDGSETVDAADVEASGWRCPVCLRTSAHGTPRVRPCPRCLRRFRSGYEDWRDLAAARRRLRRRLNTLDAEPAPFSARRFARFRELDDRLAEARRRVESTEQTRDHLQHALDEAEAAELRAEERAQRARTPAGAERRRSERDAHATQARRAREALAALDAELATARGAAAALAAEVEELERELHRRHRAEEQARARSHDRRSAERTRLARELREVEIELGALAPDAAALLDAFDAWGQAPDRWLGEG